MGLLLGAWLLLLLAAVIPLAFVLVELFVRKEGRRDSAEPLAS